MAYHIDDLIYNRIHLPIPASILQPYAYIKDIPGANQNIRQRFLVAFNTLYYGISDDAVLAEIADIITVFHELSLLIDDIEDLLDFRRGLPAAHTQFGVPLTLNLANLMYFIALQRATTNLPKLFYGEDPSQEPSNAPLGAHHTEMAFQVQKILVDEMLNLHHGQGLDIYWRDSGNVVKNNLPSIEDYLKMVMDKTGGLFRLLVKLLELVSQYRQSSKVPLANLLGVVYQIRDDYLNLVDPNYSHNKGFQGEDLVEGKLSLPILHCLRTSGALLPVYSILYEIATAEERKRQPQLIEAAIECMHQTGSLAFTRDLLHSYIAKTRDLIETNEGGETPLLVQIVDRLVVE